MDRCNTILGLSPIRILLLGTDFTSLLRPQLSKHVNIQVFEMNLLFQRFFMKKLR